MQWWYSESFNNKKGIWRSNITKI